MGPVITAPQGVPVLPTPGPVPAVSPLLTLDQEALFSRSALGRRIIADLDQDRGALQAENRRIEAELSAEEQELTRMRGTIEAAEFARLAADFDEKVQRIRETQDRKALAMQGRLEAGRRNFVQQAAPVLAAIARERGAVVVLDNTVVLMAFDVVDITDEAVTRLDAALGAGRRDLGPTTPSPDLRPLPRAPGLPGDAAPVAPEPD